MLWGVPDIFYAIKHNSSGSLLPAALVGFIFGAVLCYPCIGWIKHNQQEGKVRIGYFAEGVIVIGWIGIVAFSWLVAQRMVPGFCVLLREKGPNDCIAAAPVFQTTIEVTWLSILYVWGILFERRIGDRLRFRIPLFDYAQEEEEEEGVKSFVDSLS